MTIAGKIVGANHAVTGARTTFARVAATFKVYDEEKLWETWRYLSHTREKKGEAHYDLENAMLTARWLIDRVTFIESVVGQNETVDWIEKAYSRAQEIKREQDEAAEREALFGKQNGEAS